VKVAALVLSTLALVVGGAVLATVPRRRRMYLGASAEMEPQESRIEITCVLLPDKPDKTEVERTDETRAMWRRAQQVAGRFKISSRFEERHDAGDACTYGDAYLYPSLRRLVPVLDALDKARVGYDNIDLPVRAPRGLVRGLRSRYPRGTGVMVNEGEFR